MEEADARKSCAAWFTVMWLLLLLLLLLLMPLWGEQEEESFEFSNVVPCGTVLQVYLGVHLEKQSLYTITVRGGTVYFENLFKANTSTGLKGLRNYLTPSGNLQERTESINNK